MQNLKVHIFILILIQLLFSRIPEIDLSFRQEKSRQKNDIYQLYKKSQQQITNNQKKYDVLYYGLDLSLDIIDHRIAGSNQILVEVLADSLKRLELDFWDEMNVKKVFRTAAADIELNYKHNNDILELQFDSTYISGDKISFVIHYQGNPTNNPYRDFSFDTHNEQPMIWTLNEPFGARAWFPCKDVPSDKADSMDMRVTVPTGLDVVSNGLLKAKIVEEDSTTFWWHEKYPIASYLISLAVHPYRKFSDWYVYGDRDSMEVQYYVFQDNYPARKSDYRKTVDMLAYFSSIFGEYPFIDEKYGHAEFLWGGGMEHQTISSMGGASEMLIAHELAHQWWGNAVTCHSFHDLWLNEGFASYAEALWFEFAYDGFTASSYQKHAEYFGPGRIYIENLGEESLFDVNLRYNKASWVLHMLRHVVGDDIFFDILKNYYRSSKFQYKSATTEDFIELCKDVSGVNLDKFFQQWIYGEYYPEYFYSWDYSKVDSGYIVDLSIVQEQVNTGPFWMPIDIKISDQQGENYFTVMDSTRNQKFELFVKNKPQDLQLDPDNWILKEINHPGYIVNNNFATEFKLLQNYPNPFNSSTRIAFSLPSNAKVILSVYNSLGQNVADLVNDNLQSGSYEIQFQPNDLASGIYFYKLETEDLVEIKKMILMK